MLSPAQHEEPDQKSFVGEELHAATARIMCERGESDYSAAFQIALKRNPDLAKRYGEAGPGVQDDFQASRVVASGPIFERGIDWRALVGSHQIAE